MKVIDCHFLCMLSSSFVFGPCNDMCDADACWASRPKCPCEFHNDGRWWCLAFLETRGWIRARIQPPNLPQHIYSHSSMNKHSSACHSGISRVQHVFLHIRRYVNMSEAGYVLNHAFMFPCVSFFYPACMRIFLFFRLSDRWTYCE